MIGRIIRLMFLTLVFITGVLIGGIYTPELTAYTKAEDQHKKVDQHRSKPSKKTHRKTLRTV